MASEAKLLTVEFLKWVAARGRPAECGAVGATYVTEPTLEMRAFRPHKGGRYGRGPK